MVVIVEWAAHHNALPAPSGCTESEPLRYLGDGDLPRFLHDLSKSLSPSLSPLKLSLADRMVTRDSRTAGTAATRNWIARGECAWLRKVAQVPPLGTRFDVRDSLREHGVHGRQATLPVRVERSRDLKAEMVGTPMDRPTHDNGVESFVEPTFESAKRVLCCEAATLHGALPGTSSRLHQPRRM